METNCQSNPRVVLRNVRVPTLELDSPELLVSLRSWRCPRGGLNATTPLGARIFLWVMYFIMIQYD